MLAADPETACLDPVLDVPTLNLICNVLDPVTRQRYSRDPRYIAQKAEKYLRTTGIAEVSYWGPELEFYIFDDVRYDQTAHRGYYFIDSNEGVWNTGRRESPNLGYKLRHKEGYFPTPPADTLQNVRSEIILKMKEVGVPVEVHHHEVGTAGQGEIDMKYTTLTKMADSVMYYKYLVRNVARKHGKTATFMPKPIFGDNGSGMHTHQSLWSSDTNLFWGEGLRANQPDSQVLHRSAAQRSGAFRSLRSDDKLIPTPGAGIRGSCEPGVLPAQPVGRCAHPRILQQIQIQTY